MNGIHKRRWYQFSLKTLLLIITFLCLIPGGFVAYHRNQSRRQELAVRAIEEMLGEVSYDKSALPRSVAMNWFLGDDKYSHVQGVDFFWNAYHLSDLENGRSEPAFAQELRTRGVHRVTDVELRYLEGMKGLESLHLDGMDISGAGLARLREFTHLQWLSLGSTHITDNGLKCLEGLTELETLNLGDTDIGDAGLAHLAGLTKMQQLHLTNTRVTDAGLTHLKALTHLELLDIEGTQVTDSGADEFNKAAPGLMVVR